MSVKTVGRTKKVQNADNRVGTPRQRALLAMDALVTRAVKKGELPKANLSLALGDSFLFRGQGNVRAVAVEMEGHEGLPAYPRYDRVMVDDKNKTFYVDHHVEGQLGPFPLPKGVTLATLLDDGRPFPRAKNELQKAVGALAKVVEEGLPRAYAKGSRLLDFRGGAFRAPDGERLAHHYIDDHTGRIPGGAVMIGKRNFWVEMIPGISGQALGPFPLPKDFNAKALSKGGNAPTPKRNDAFDSGGSSRPSVHLSDSGRWPRPSYVNSGSGIWPVSPGGRPS
ncbi:MAG: hypothetical protein ACOZIN_04275 [Myxococcota bacterium]